MSRESGYLRNGNQRMLKRSGPALALAALFVLYVYGVSLSSQQLPHYQTVKRHGQTAAKKIPPESPEDRIADYTTIRQLSP
jgi:hypothetical protein